jgi:hypothetical protein
MLGTHPTSWNATYNIVRWIRSSNTFRAVPWFDNQRKDASCGKQPVLELKLMLMLMRVPCLGHHGGLPLWHM